MKPLYCTIIAGLAAASLTGCHNADIEFGDYDIQTVYFARQTPVRTITLGEDVYSTDLDNQHRFEVYARVAGVESNKKDRTIYLEVDNSLCDGLKFDDGSAVTPLPNNYYELDDSKIVIKKGEVTDCVGVHLTDAYFADPLAPTLHYVLPLKIASATDSILDGKGYTLYALKYKNKYTGCWLNQGKDEITLPDGTTETKSRYAEYWEYADLCYFTTDALNVARYKVSYNATVYDEKGKSTISTKTCDLILTFNSDETCTVTTDTDGCTVNGSGLWEYHDEPLAWNKADRDRITLNYTIGYTYESAGEQVTTTVKTSETLVMRDRQNSLEDF